MLNVRPSKIDLRFESLDKGSHELTEKILHWHPKAMKGAPRRPRVDDGSVQQRPAKVSLPVPGSTTEANLVPYSIETVKSRIISLVELPHLRRRAIFSEFGANFAFN